jgi:surface antigen
MIMKKLMIATVLATTLMSGCAGTYNKATTGAALGALTGGALAYGLGGNSSNKELWTVLGIGLGAVVGNNIGAQLDERDRLLMGQTFQNTMETAPTNQVGGWNNPDSGNSGTIVPTQTRYTDGQPCREFTTTVYIGGKEQEGYGTACRQADGSWKIVQS